VDQAADCPATEEDEVTTKRLAEQLQTLTTGTGPRGVLHKEASPAPIWVSVMRFEAGFSLRFV
jgi:hypothetical protein